MTATETRLDMYVIARKKPGDDISEIQYFQGSYSDICHCDMSKLSNWGMDSGPCRPLPRTDTTDMYLNMMKLVDPEYDYCLAELILTKKDDDDDEE